VVGDVSGHGLGAALVMAQARALLRAFSATERDLPRVMNRLNDFLSADMSGGRFMSAFVALADPSRGVLEWQNAGHPPALLCRASPGHVERLAAHGRVLGVFPGADYEPTPPITLAEGDTLLLYTDGATEALNREGTMLGEDGLAEVLVRASGGGPAAVLEAVRERLIDWTGSETFKDDLTLVALQLVRTSS
jgi:sigma-B regulation protein RsbU (phosphoserine phosphatase)